MALLKRKRAGLNDAMSVVTRFVNACNRHDADGVGACLHPDFDSIQPMYPSRNFRGADQVRRNWQAIFDAEPGFRLTVLRSAAMDDTVWLELHGAGREAEVAGVFIMGIQGDRIRWARIYSALVEPVPPGMVDDVPPAPLQEVPPLGEPGSGEAAGEPLIAPVLDMERSGRRRRRRRGGSDGESVEAAAANDVVMTPEPEVEDTTEAEADAATDAPVVDDEGDAEREAVEAVEVVEVVEMVEIEPEVVVVAEEEADVAPVAQVVVAEIDGEPAAEVVVAEIDGEPAGEVRDAVADDGGPPTEAVEMASLTEPDRQPDPDPDPPVAGDDPKRRFGKKRF